MATQLHKLVLDAEKQVGAESIGLDAFPLVRSGLGITLLVCSLHMPAGSAPRPVAGWQLKAYPCAATTASLARPR